MGSFTEAVEHFQRLRRPEDASGTEWGSKIHLAVVPVYYQNYLYGELVALHAAGAYPASPRMERARASRSSGSNGFVT